MTNETDIKDKLAELPERGFLDVQIDPTVDLFAEIDRMKKEKNAVILAHYYQTADIQDIADFIGDSLQLAQQAEKTTADIILFAGVHFMAETAKILNPTKKVILPDLNAGCSLAESCPAEDFAAFKKKFPGYAVVSYINCTAEIKALSDYIVTSSNAEIIVNSIPQDQGIIFAPDKNLGAYLVKKLNRDMVLWDGACMVHEIFSLDKIIALQEKYPEAKLIAHPECEAALLDMADYIGSTTNLLKYTMIDDSQEYIVATETGILHKMMEASPNKTFIPAPPENNCACNDCPHMKLNTLEKVYLCLKYEVPELQMEETLRVAAKIPIDRMLDISAKAGLK